MDRTKSPNSKNLRVEDFKDFLHKVKQEKKEKERKEAKMKEESIKSKLKSIKSKINEEKSKKNEEIILYDHSSPSKMQFIQIDETDMKNEGDVEPMNITNDNIVLVDENASYNREDRTSSAYKKRNLINFQSTISEVMKDLKEEKTIIPKKKVNYVGLKMYLKEMIKNNKEQK